MSPEPTQLGSNLPPAAFSAPTLSASLRNPHPPSARVVPVGGSSGLGDVADAPVEVPLVLVKGDDGILRPRQLDAIDVGDHTHPDPWGDRVRFRPGPPGPDLSAPEGAVHIDTTTGRGYRLRNLEES